MKLCFPSCDLDEMPTLAEVTLREVVGRQVPPLGSLRCRL